VAGVTATKDLQHRSIAASYNNKILMQRTQKQMLAKNSLLIAVGFTVFFAGFLVWADYTLANHFKPQNQVSERPSATTPASARPANQIP